MVSVQRRRCRAGFAYDEKVSTWVGPDAGLRFLPPDFDRCVREAGHSSRGGHILAEGGAYDDKGVLKYNNRTRKFDVLVEDWMDGQSLWVSEDYLRAIKKDIAEMSG